MKKEEITRQVRAHYADAARQNGSCCCSGAYAEGKSVSCCGTNSAPRAGDISKSIGYSEADVSSVPEGSNLGLGCGNPIALASLKEGEIVLDLGSGAGFDCFLASQRVGPQGKVIGVDMTPEMLDKARENARKGNYQNVEFRLGEIENLPAADSSVDVVISNCVINLSRDKPGVFKEAFRVLKPGGRIMVSDIVLLGDLPEKIRDSIEAYVGCIAGASKKSDYLDAINAAGFQDVRVVGENAFLAGSMIDDPTINAIVEEAQITPSQMNKLAPLVVSIRVSGTRT